MLVDGPDTGLQRLGGLVQQVQGRLLGDVAVLADGFVPFFQQGQFFPQPVPLGIQLGCLVPLALVLPVPGQDVLLGLDEFVRGDQLRRQARMARQLFGVLGLLVCNLADGPALVVQVLLDRKSVV